MITQIDNRLAAVERVIAAISLLSLLGLSLTQILARNLFDTGFIQVDLINRHLLITAGLMGAGVAITEMRHIKIDALAAVLSDRVKQILRTPLFLFSACVSAALCYYAIIFCIDEWEYTPANERFILPMLLAYPTSFAFMCLHFVFAIFRKQDTA